MKDSRSFSRMLMASVLSVTAFFIVFSGTGTHPSNPDEQAYAGSAVSFAEWLGLPSPFSRENLEKYWNNGPEHPSAVKMLSGFSWLAFHKNLGDLRSLRLATAISFSVMIFFLYLLSGEFFKGIFPFAVCVFVMCVPKAMDYTRLAEINVNMEVLWVLSIFCMLKAARQGWAWQCLSGVFAGLAVDSKITSILIPISVIIWLLCCRRERVKEILPLFFICGIIAFLISWFSIWPDPVRGVLGHLSYYRGNFWDAPGQVKYPGPLSIIASIPAGFFVLFAAGAVGIFRKNDTHGMLAVIIVLLTACIYIVPKVASEGVRYFLPAIPFFCIVCASGLEFLLKISLKGVSGNA